MIYNIKKTNLKDMYFRKYINIKIQDFENRAKNILMENKFDIAFKIYYFISFRCIFTKIKSH